MTGTAWDSARDNGIVARVAVLAVSGFLFAVGFKIFPATASSVLGVVAVFSCYGLAFCMLTWAFIGEANVRSGGILTAGAFLFGVTASVAFGILVEIPTYGTDVLSFAHAAGEGLLGGLNPYDLTIVEMRPLLDSIGYNDGLATPTIGEPLERLLFYPAGHLLYFTSFLALGLGDLRWATLAAELVTLAFVWWAVSPLTRVLLPLVILLEPYLATIFTAGGNSDWLWVLPLAVSAYLLHEDRLTWSGLWLGFACAMKQQPWFAVPFMLIYAWKSRRMKGGQGDHEIASMAAMIAAGFLLPNLPFLLWDPGVWVNGVLGPLLLDLAPAGQGVSLLTSQGWFEISKTSLTIAMSLVAVVAVAVYWRFFPKARNLLWVLPGMILFFSSRSLHSYFVYWIPIAILWLDLEYRDTRAPSDAGTRTRTV